jgi:hypothetical protein
MSGCHPGYDCIFILADRTITGEIVQELIMLKKISVSDGEITITRIPDCRLADAMDADFIISAGCPGR